MHKPISLRQGFNLIEQIEFIYGNDSRWLSPRAHIYNGAQSKYQSWSSFRSGKQDFNEISTASFLMNQPAGKRPFL